jgi:hypothetical protein
MTTTATKTWHAKVSKPSETVVLHLMDIATKGEDRTRLTSPDEVSAYLTAHPEIEEVNIYDSRFPRRAFPVGKFDDAMRRKLFR